MAFQIPCKAPIAVPTGEIRDPHPPGSSAGRATGRSIENAYFSRTLPLLRALILFPGNRWLGQRRHLPLLPSSFSKLLEALLLTGILLASAFASPAEAAIGDLRPVALEKAQAKGFSLTRTDRRSGYTALTFHKTQPGTMPGAPAHDLTVREFFDSSGRSVAVAWKGSLRPDLPSLLGDLYTHLPAVNHSPNRHRFFYQDGSLVITSVGTSLVHAGAAWDPARLPSGLPPSRIRLAP